MRRFTGIFLVILALACSIRVEAEEILRIRVENKAGGLIQVSVDGRNCDAVGRVLRPATKSIEGFSAAAYIEPGRVAATAVHGIRMKTGEASPKSAWEKRKPLMFSLVPFEFAAAPRGFGGHLPLESGIYTDIPSGKTIFRNLAPYVGNKVYLETKSGIEPLPQDYAPASGDVLVIVVERPARWPREICFENKRDGKVTATYADGTKETITTVEKPVTGTGRYDGTSYTGQGRINTNHPGVLTVSTAPLIIAGKEGDGVETRGGFQIIPSYHVRYTSAFIPQTMVIGPAKPEQPVLEGKEPLFAGYLGLAWDTVDDKHSFLTQVKIDNGQWESVPQIIGKLDNAFTAEGLNQYHKERGIIREVEKGVTHIRILFPSDDREFIIAEVQRAVGAYVAAAATALPEEGVKVVNGTYVVNDPVGRLPYGSVVAFFIDGQVKKISAAAPHVLEWDTRRVSNGKHVIDVRATDAAGNLIKTSTIEVLVKNG